MHGTPVIRLLAEKSFILRGLCHNKE